MPYVLQTGKANVKCRFLPGGSIKLNCLSLRGFSEVTSGGERRKPQ